VDSVAFFHSVWDVNLDIAANPAQEAVQQSCARNTIHVVITVDKDLLLPLLGTKDFVLRRFEVGE
jgi:hypothetical protein